MSVKLNSETILNLISSSSLVDRLRNSGTGLASSGTEEYSSFIYKRTYSKWLQYLTGEKRREEWPETVTRYITMMCERWPHAADEIIALADSIYNLEAVPSMRALASAGPAAARDEVAVYNCAYTGIDSVEAFDEILYLLSCGTGVGFSVEKVFTEKLPVVPERLAQVTLYLDGQDMINKLSDDAAIHIVRDSKIGWAEAFRALNLSLYSGTDIAFDFNSIRPEGTPLKVFGGRASGPLPLYHLFAFTVSVFKEAISSGQIRLNSVQVSDIVCKTAQSIVVGGVRRCLEENQLVQTMDRGLVEIKNLNVGERVLFPKSEKGLKVLAKENVGAKAGYKIFHQTGSVIASADHLWPVSLSDEIYSTLTLSDEEHALNVIDELGSQTSYMLKTTSLQQVLSRPDFKRGDVSMLKVTLPEPTRYEYSEGWSIENPYENLPENIMEAPFALRFAALSQMLSDPSLFTFDAFHLVWSMGFTTDSETFCIDSLSCGHINNLESLLKAKDLEGIEAYEELLLTSDSFYADSPVFFIQEIGDVNMYDIEVDSPNLFVVNGIVSHNSALLCLTDLEDTAMSKYKSNEWWVENDQRALANISAAYNEMPTLPVFMDEWNTMYKSYSGERGIFSRFGAIKKLEKVGRRDISLCENTCGVNPCGEQILRHGQFCNLSEIIVRPTDSIEKIKSKIESAVAFGTMQSAFTSFRYLRDLWQDNTAEERLLGVSLTGIYEHPILGDINNPELPEILEEMKNTAIEVNKRWAKLIGIKASLGITTMKPSGTVSQLTNTSPGVNPRPVDSPFYIRHVRVDCKDPLARFMRDRGFPLEIINVGSTQTFVFKFPMINEHAKSNDALHDFELWRIYNQHWSEHAVSTTINYKDSDFMALGQKVYGNLDSITGVAFLPYSGHIYELAPYTPCTKQEYDDLLKDVPTGVDWSLINQYEEEDHTIASQSLACAGGACEMVDIEAR